MVLYSSYKGGILVIESIMEQEYSTACAALSCLFRYLFKLYTKTEYFVYETFLCIVLD